MNFTDQLDLITAEAKTSIESLPQMQAMLSGDLSRVQYVDFLRNLYPIVSNFCPIMAFAAGHCADQYDEVRRYLYDHIFEEREHEQLVLADLRAFGIDTTDVPSRLPSPPVQAMLACNYRAVSVYPVHVLGMIYVLEIMAFLYGGRVAQAVSASMGRTVAEGFTFLDSHADLDEDHTIQLRNLLLAIHGDNDVLLLNSVKLNFYLFANVISFRDNTSFQQSAGLQEMSVATG